MKTPVRIAITGAAGQDGYYLAAHLVGIRPQQHLTAGQWLPAGLVEGLATIAFIFDNKTWHRVFAW